MCNLKKSGAAYLKVHSVFIPKQTLFAQYYTALLRSNVADPATFLASNTYFPLCLLVYSVNIVNIKPLSFNFLPETT